MNDLELHNLVKDSLSELRPTFEEKHWRLMQAKLILSPVLFPWKLLLSIALPITFIGAWWWQTQKLPTEVTTSVELAPVNIADETEGVPILAPRIPDATAKTPLAPRTKKSKDAPNTPVVGDTRVAISTISYQGITSVPAIIAPPSLKTFFIEELIKSLLLHKTIKGDSTTYNALERNKEKWSNAAVVCDWTSSMFPYGTQIFTWLDQNQHNEALIGYLFFNDCDVTGNQLEAGNVPGGMYYTTDRDPNEILKVMIAAVRQGIGNSDLKENDLEALVYASNLYTKADELVLIADNVSPVRYPYLIENINKPVRIIICGTTMNDEAIQSDYLDLARATGGSIHTIEDDLENLENIPNGKWIRVGDDYYRYKQKKGKFVKTNRQHRPKGANP